MSIFRAGRRPQTECTVDMDPGIGGLCHGTDLFEAIECARVKFTRLEADDGRHVGRLAKRIRKRTAIHTAGFVTRYVGNGASSDAEQLAEICDRVLVFARGRICREIIGAELTKDGIAEACYASIKLSGGAEHYQAAAPASGS